MIYITIKCEWSKDKKHWTFMQRTILILENKYSNIRGVMPQSSLSLPSTSFISPIMVYVLPLPVCKKTTNASKFALQFIPWETYSPAWVMTYLTICKHTAIIPRQAILHHGQSSNPEQLLLHPIHAIHLISVHANRFLSSILFSVVMQEKRKKPIHWMIH